MPIFTKELPHDPLAFRPARVGQICQLLANSSRILWAKSIQHSADISLRQAREEHGGFAKGRLHVNVSGKHRSAFIPLRSKRLRVPSPQSDQGDLCGRHIEDVPATYDESHDGRSRMASHRVSSPLRRILTRDFHFVAGSAAILVSRRPAELLSSPVAF